jgi:hypothetical protein
MKKALGIGAALLAALFLFLSWKRGSFPGRASLARAQAPRAKARVGSLRAARGEAIAAQDLRPLTNGATPAPAACVELWERISGRTATQVQEDVRRGDTKFGSECMASDPLGAGAQAVYAACAFDSAAGKLKDETLCMGSLVFYRAGVIDSRSSDRKDYKGMSDALLANKIISGLFKMNGDPGYIPEVVAMIEEFVTRAPDAPDARKALVASKLMLFGTEGYSFDKMREAALAALALNPGDGQVTEAYLLNEIKSGNTAAADDFLRENPNSGLGYYFRAWQAMESGDRGGAIENLKTASRLLPDDQRIKDTLAAVRGGKSKDAFKLTVGFKLGDL